MITYRKKIIGKWQSSLLAFFLLVFSCSTSLSFDSNLQKGTDDPKEITSFKEVYGTDVTSGRAPEHLILSSGSAVPFAFAQPDSTAAGDFDFSENEDESHLVRDIVVFAIASVFVAYFLIKVFLQGDTEEPEDEDTGKPLPGYGF